MFLLLSLNTAFAKSDGDKNKSHQNSEYSKEITVNGMVCAFCSNSLEKKFKKEKSVEKVHVDLGKRKVSVKFKKGKSIKDKKLIKMIAASGFSVVDIKSKQQKVKGKSDQK